MMFPPTADSRTVGAYKTALLCDPCSYCDGGAALLDHIDARSSRRHRGANWENVTAACASCNNAKRGQTLLGFLGLRANRPRFAEADRERHDWWRLGR